MRLLERERELATLEAVVLEGGVVTVEGGAGIGKTSLLAAAAAQAAELGYDVRGARSSKPASPSVWSASSLNGA